EKQTSQFEPHKSLHAIDGGSLVDYIRYSFPKPLHDVNPNVFADVSVKVEESDQDFEGLDFITHDGSHPLPSTEESLAIDESQSQRKENTTPLDSDYSFSPHPKSSSRFDRNEAWNIAEHVRAESRHPPTAVKTLSPFKRQRGRPSSKFYKKITVENYKTLSAPGTLPLHQSIRDGFDTGETDVSGKPQSTKRRKRSPAPPGIGPLSVSFGIKPTTFRSITKGLRRREKFVIDPDLLRNTEVKATSKAVNLLGMQQSPGKTAPTNFHHTKTNAITRESGSPRVLPPLRTIEVGPANRELRHRTNILPIVSDLAKDIDHARHSTLESDGASGFSPDDFHLGTSFISRETSDMGQHDDELGLNEAAATDSATPTGTSKMKPGAGRRRLSSLMSTGKTYVKGETRKVSPPLAGSVLHGRPATWAGAFGDLRPRPIKALPRENRNLGSKTTTYPVTL
ncbi:hypothetical protein CORC01_09480, partial [Colletotrichum orchidophilum]